MLQNIYSAAFLFFKSKYLTRKFFLLHYKKIIREYFNFSRSQRRAIFALLAVSVLAIALPGLLAKFKKNEKISDEKLIAVRNLLAGNDSTSVQRVKVSNTGEAVFYFNPNTASKQDWIALGIYENLAQRIINYTSKGGKFHKKTDLLKTYGFTQADLDRLSPYMLFDDEQSHQVAQNEFAETENIIVSPFNPNKLSKEQWMQLGVKEYVAERFVNYVAKGGKFRTPEDLLKTYGFQQQDYERLKDYMVFDNEVTQAFSQQTTQTSVSSEKQITEINSATIDQLIALGFSNYNATSIINFRDGSGGFYALIQLNDVYNIDSTTLNNALPFLTINPANLQKIHINTATYEQLEKHAYLSEKTAQAIIDYRNTKGKFIIISELQSVKGIYPELFEKLKPYLTL